MKRTSKGYSHALVCYGAPLDIKVSFQLDKAVAKEGKRKRYCRECLKSAMSIFEEAIIGEFNKLGLR